MRNNKGITLIALVITIIVLLILAGVSIAMLSGDNSIFKKANESAKQTAIATAKEEMMVAFNEAVTDDYYSVYYQHNPSAMISTIKSKLDAAATKASREGVTVSYSGTTTAGGTVTITYTADSTTVTGTVAETTTAGLYSFTWNS